MSPARTVPGRRPWAQIATVFAAMFGGPFLGLQLGVRLAPGSEVVQTLSVFVFALVFVGGLLLWMGIGIVAVVAGFVANLTRGSGPRPQGLGRGDRLVPPGYRAFPILGVGFGTLVGLLAGLLTDLPVGGAWSTWALAGLAYGLALWAAAHHGYLPFPEPE